MRNTLKGSIEWTVTDKCNAYGRYALQFLWRHPLLHLLLHFLLYCWQSYIVRRLCPTKTRFLLASFCIVCVVPNILKSYSSCFKMLSTCKNYIKHLRVPAMLIMMYLLLVAHYIKICGYSACCVVICESKGIFLYWARWCQIEHFKK